MGYSITFNDLEDMRYVTYAYDDYQFAKNSGRPINKSDAKEKARRELRGYEFDGYKRVSESELKDYMRKSLIIDNYNETQYHDYQPSEYRILDELRHYEDSSSLWY